MFNYFIYCKLLQTSQYFMYNTVYAQNWKVFQVVCSMFNLTHLKGNSAIFFIDFPYFERTQNNGISIVHTFWFHITSNYSRCINLFTYSTVPSNDITNRTNWINSIDKQLACCPIHFFPFSPYLIVIISRWQKAV